MRAPASGGRTRPRVGQALLDAASDPGGPDERRANDPDAGAEVHRSRDVHGTAAARRRKAVKHDPRTGLRARRSNVYAHTGGFVVEVVRIYVVSTEFLLTTLVIVATPGTGVLYTLAAGLARGARASVVAAFGCTLGVVPHMVAAITGLAALLHTSALAFQVLKYLGVAYLLFMAWSTLKDKSELTADKSAPLPARKVIVSGVLINLLNPKLTLFFFAFLPQFVSTTEAHASLRMLGLSAIFMLVTFAVFALYGVCAAAVRDRVISRPGVITWMRRVFGAAFVALAGRLAVTGR
ncbi:MAG TPA: LysE family translocator [Solirubrobacteraceae bacterium]|nr:LysE family translocator [Solirubrobacteraceae bacterium]